MYICTLFHSIILWYTIYFEFYVTIDNELAGWLISQTIVSQIFAVKLHFQITSKLRKLINNVVAVSMFLDDKKKTVSKMLFLKLLRYRFIYF